MLRELIVKQCLKELETNPESKLADSILEALGVDVEGDETVSESEPEPEPEDIDRKILEYVAQAGNCVPDAVMLVDAEDCIVYKVTVKLFNEGWPVPVPKFFYVCPSPIMNLYRDDQQTPRPWQKEQFESEVIDMVKTYHIGLTVRLQLEADSEELETDNEDSEESETDNEQIN